MSLTICNYHGKLVYVAIGFADNTCRPPREPPHFMGWWSISPGSCAVVYENDVNEYSPVWHYQADDGAGVFWGGTYIQYLPDQAFNRCWNSSTDGTRYGFRNLFVGDNEDFTLQLIS